MCRLRGRRAAASRRCCRSSGCSTRRRAASTWLNGKPVANLTMRERARTRNREIGFIFQNFNLIGDLTVFDNVELPLTYRGMPSAERRKRVQDALERVGMAHRAKHYPSQLSGGQQQRVAVARAVAGEPSILLADEPTGNLDSKNGEAVMELLRELHRAGATLCMVTHDPRYARHADRTIHLFDGQIVDEQHGAQAESGNRVYEGLVPERVVRERVVLEGVLRLERRAKKTAYGARGSVVPMTLS